MACERVPNRHHLAVLRDQVLSFAGYAAHELSFQAGGFVWDRCHDAVRQLMTIRQSGHDPLERVKHIAQRVRVKRESRSIEDLHPLYTVPVRCTESVVVRVHQIGAV